MVFMLQMFTDNVVNDFSDLRLAATQNVPIRPTVNKPASSRELSNLVPKGGG